MTSPQERLLRLVAEAGAGVGLTRPVDLVRVTGLSKSTIDRFNRGHAVSESTQRKISLAVGWTAESAQDVLNGGEPTRVPDDDVVDRQWRREPAVSGDLSMLIRNIVFEAVIGTNPDTPASKIREIEERANKLAREAGYTVARERQGTHIEEDPAP